MSCGVALERLHIDKSNILTTQLKFASSDVSEPNASQQTCEKNQVLDLQTDCNSVEKSLSKTHKKQGQKMRRDDCCCNSNHDGCICNVPSSTADLRLTLKKVKVESNDKEEATCLYVCQTQKCNSPKKLVTECAGGSTVNNITSAATKDSNRLTDTEKVLYS